ncbi:hypothetical protein DFH28DRAFT_1127623 [Melampsora americana]|nr:hypothetical protein DFH28DRAFT_1127623 [Melampsora americana]
MSSPKVTDLIKEVLLLSQNCPSIRKATTDEKLYNMFSNSLVDPSIDEDTITITVNTNLDNVYGVDCGSTYLLSGIHGIQRVLEYIDTAQKHPNWTSNVDMIVLCKLEGMKDKLKAAGATRPAVIQALGPGNTGHKPSKKVANKNAANVAAVLDHHAMGKKHPVLDVDNNAGQTIKKNKTAGKDKTNSSKAVIARRSVKDTGENL